MSETEAKMWHKLFLRHDVRIVVDRHTWVVFEEPLWRVYQRNWYDRATKILFEDAYFSAIMYFLLREGADVP